MDRAATVPTHLALPGGANLDAELDRLADMNASVFEDGRTHERNWGPDE